MRTLPVPIAPLLAAALLAALGGAACGGGRTPEAPLTAAPASERTLSLGRVVGAEARFGGHVWRGLPFARPPVGPLRWRAPQPPEPWTGVREALAHPAACPQFAAFSGGRDGAAPDTPTGSEDCLYLNVFAPAFPPDAVPRGEARLPVMVWIHGGGNSVGDMSIYDGSRLATAHDLVVVTVQYRLGPFGWLRHPALRDGATPEEASGNFGTLDLVAALRWVRAHVAAFGGDPGNVTIFGESAGGTNVYTLLLSPLAHGLFEHAIVQSGSPSTLPPEAGESTAALAPLGKANASDAVVRRLLGDAAAGGSAEVAAALRAKSAADVLEAYTGERRIGMIDMPKVFADGVVLPAGDALDALAAGHYNRVPVVLGTNHDEMKLFQIADRERVLWLLGVPVGLKNRTRYDRDAEWSTRFWKLRGVDEPARRMRAVQGPTVFAYRFDWDEEPSILWVDFAELLGAAHAFEIPFVFGNFDLGRPGRALFDDANEPGRLRLSAQMMSWWAAFARSGDPGRGAEGENPLWSAWDESGPDAGRFLVLDTAASGGPHMSSQALTENGLLAGIAADPRFSGAAERCAALAALARWRGGLSESELARGGCTPDAMASR